MSNNLKTQLFMATAMFAVSSTGAFAQQTKLEYPAAELHGVGASSVQITITRELNCFGPLSLGATGNKRGSNAGTTSTVAQGVSVDATNKFTCGSDFIQPNIGGKYIATGSTDGKAAWKNKIVTGIFGTSTKIWPTDFGTDATAWGNAHYSLSDAPIDSGEVGTFTGNTKGGAPIQFPLFVIPVSLAYNPVYGLKFADATAATTPTTSTPTATYQFKVAQPVSLVIGTASTTNPAVPAGGLRLSKKVYCRIFNGYITNWNSPEITALNVPAKGAAYPLKADGDDTTRWNTEGVPIRLVGRFDGSGTTDIFTRHLAEVCTSTRMGGSSFPNLYLRAAEGLPWDPSLPTLTGSNSGTTRYVNGAVSTNFAGGANTLSGAVYHSSTGAVNAGTEAPGLFGVANGSGGVAAAINRKADKASTVDTTVTLNGKLGYISADFVVPAAGQLLYSAAVEVGDTQGTKKPLFAMPTALNATAAFGTKILPPESDKSGKYVKSGIFSRSNPIDWYGALYFGDSQLSNPPVGYPITGTTQILTGTCFADKAVRNALVTYLTAHVGKLTFDSKFGNKKLLGSFFTSTAAKTLGLSAQAGLAPLPKAWNTAIYETFLIRSKQKNAADGALLVDRNLYIQAGIPTKAGIGKGKDVLSVDDLPSVAAPVVSGKTVYEAAPNSTCATVTGL